MGLALDVPCDRFGVVAFEEAVTLPSSVVVLRISNRGPDRAVAKLPASMLALPFRCTVFSPWSSQKSRAPPVSLNPTLSEVLDWIFVPVIVPPAIVPPSRIGAVMRPLVMTGPSILTLPSVFRVNLALPAWS